MARETARGGEILSLLGLSYPDEPSALASHIAGSDHLILFKGFTLESENTLCSGDLATVNPSGLTITDRNHNIILGGYGMLTSCTGSNNHR